MEYKTFTEEEFPYHILEQFGLPQTMIEDFPMRILDDLASGRLSPLVPIRVKDDDGNIITSKTKFRFFRQEDDSVDVLFHPQLLHCKIDMYSKDEQTALLNGHSIVALSPDESRSKCFVQIDQTTNQVMYIPTPVIGRNLSSLMDRFRLSPEQIQAVQEGQTITFSVDEEDVTIGIDLQEKTGIKMILGNDRKWRENLSDESSRYNFGLFGCWYQNDDDSGWEYIYEEDYTEQIWAEQQKVIEQNRMIKR